ncbi:MAG: SCO family protein [Xanthomonadaceae bacterium]|nr:SCO family protein [Xanthomonadaceae bacterium]
MQSPNRSLSAPRTPTSRLGLMLTALVCGLVTVIAQAAAPTAANGDDGFERIVLSDQSGSDVRFHDLVANQRIALQFIFTSCGTVCPTMGAQFGQLQKLLARAAMDDVHLISVSIDPARDTPQRLKAWADRFGHNPERWTLLTGPAPRINDLQHRLGVGVGEKTTHPALVLVNDGRGGDWIPLDALSATDTIVAALDRLHVPDDASGDRP